MVAEALALLPCGSTAVLLAEIGKGWILANLSVSTEKELKMYIQGVLILYATEMLLFASWAMAGFEQSTEQNWK